MRDESERVLVGGHTVEAPGSRLEQLMSACKTLAGWDLEELPRAASGPAGLGLETRKWVQSQWDWLSASVRWMCCSWMNGLV